MNKVTLRYDDETQRVIQTYWNSDTPDWADEQIKGKTVTTTETTPQTRVDVLNNALDSVVAGTDYDPDSEAPVGKLCYDPQKDELYAEVEIRTLPL